MDLRDKSTRCFCNRGIDVGQRELPLLLLLGMKAFEIHRFRHHHHSMAESPLSTMCRMRFKRAALRAVRHLTINASSQDIVASHRNEPTGKTRSSTALS